MIAFSCNKMGNPFWKPNDPHKHFASYLELKIVFREEMTCYLIDVS